MKTKLFKIYILTGCLSLIFSGCISNRHYSESFNIDKVKKDCNGKGEVEIMPDGSAWCKKSEKTLALEKEERIRKNFKIEQNRINHFANYEKNYLNEYNNILKNSSKDKTTYIQPMNKKEPCKVWIQYTEDKKLFKEDSYKLYWDGECKNGYANGLGREIEKDTFLDRWSLAIYKNGIPTYYIIKDILNNNIFEGIGDSNSQINGVYTQITEKIGDIDVIDMAVSHNNETKIDLIAKTSPFWNGTYQLIKSYPNFEYGYVNYENNDELYNNKSNVISEFYLSDKENKNGWAIAKRRDKSVITAEYKMNKMSKVDLPRIYIEKADDILKEINEAMKKVYQSRDKAQLAKKQYMKKICKDKVKVKFMDNDDYKLICNNYEKEKELFTKINDKLERLSKEKIARLEQQRYSQEQKQQEQYRQQQLAIERQKLAAQQQQAQAAQKAANDAAWNNTMQNIRNNTPKFYNVMPNYGGGYTIMGF